MNWGLPSSSNGLEKYPKLRFAGYREPWREIKFSQLYRYVSEKNDGTFGTDSIISVANMYFKPDARITDDDYLKTYNVFKFGDIAFEGNKSKNFSHGRFVQNTIGDGIVSHVFVVFRPIGQEHYLDFWKYAINNECVMGRILARCTKKTTMMTNLVTNDFLSQIARCPSIQEQMKIAEFLSLLEKRIALQSELVEKLKKYKRGLLREVFDKSTPTSDGLYTCWDEVKLGEICTYRRGSFPQPYGLPEWYDEEHGTPFIQVADVNDNMTINPDTNRHISDMAKSRSVFIPKGTLIVTLQGTIGRVAITTYDAYIDRTLLVIQNIADCVLKEFLMYAIYMKFDVEKQTADGSIIKTITKETLTDFTIHLPPILEQQKIVSLLRSFDTRINNSESILTDLNKSRAALLQQLFI